MSMGSIDSLDSCGFFWLVKRNGWCRWGRRKVGMLLLFPTFSVWQWWIHQPLPSAAPTDPFPNPTASRKPHSRPPLVLWWTIGRPIARPPHLLLKKKRNGKTISHHRSKPSWSISSWHKRRVNFQSGLQDQKSSRLLVDLNFKLTTSWACLIWCL